MRLLRIASLVSVLHGCSDPSGSTRLDPVDPSVSRSETAALSVAPATRFWDSLAIEGESLFFAAWNDGEAPAADLVFVPNAVPRLRSANLELTFELGRDFTWEPGSRRITLTPDSRIPSRRCAELYPPKGSPNSIGESRVGPTALLWSEGHFFHDLQIVALYTPVTIDPGFEMTPPQEPRLPRSLAKLRAASPFRLVVLGDSISEGYNASAFTDAPPHQQPYPGLVADDLRARFGSEVTLTNLARAGTTSAWGKEQANRVLEQQPDLVILAFGMNDTGSTDPEVFGANIRSILDTVRTARPACEFILVASMLGNPEFASLDLARFPAFRDQLAKLEREGVALADLTTLWTKLLARKRFLDLTGNGVNHPNDFGHRLYARAIGDLLR